MPGLADLLKEIAQDAERKEKIAPRDMLATLRAAAPRYSSPTKFQVGDVVTPRATSDYKGRGEPAVVIAIRPDADFSFHGDPTSQAFGARHDIRVLRVVGGGTVVAFWVEGAQFELYSETNEATDQQAA